MRSDTVNSKNQEREHHQKPKDNSETVQLVEGRKPDDGPCVDSIPFLKKEGSATMRMRVKHDGARTKLLMKSGKVLRIGKNQSVRDMLPKLPARNVKASHCRMQSVEPASATTRDVTHFEWISPGKNRDKWHVRDGDKRAGDPGLEVQAAEPVLLYRAGVNEEEPEAELL